MFNKVILGGNLTRDPEVRDAGQTKVTRLGLATNRKFKSGNETKERVTFVDIDVWGKLGETCAEYLKKGRQVLIEGRLDLDTWEKDGEKRSKLFVTAENVQFLGPKEVSEKTEETSSDGEDTPF